MVSLRRLRKNFYAGLLIVLFGLFFAIGGTAYRVGTLTNMGPGFFPMALGIVLALVGIGIVATPDSVPEGGGGNAVRPDWRGCACIVAGVIAFIVLGTYAGLLPATFFCIFIASLGDRRATLKGSLLLAIGLTIFGVVLFSYFLGNQIPILRW